MENKIGVLLASHGKFAQEALNSLKMILGTVENIEAVALEPGTDLSGFVEVMEAKIEKLNTEDGLLILSDIYGGTPSNAAAIILLNHQQENFIAYSGLNLAVLLEIANNRNLSFVKFEDSIQQVLPLIFKKIEVAPLEATAKEEEEL
ncbi:hypothetical protein A5867_000730 [Enterococcus sp. 6D12_DIV0197]|uniref:PTS sugar transporter subunit IIA n=1 Tax=Enterococcus TaxID=1350 RepID=UPI000B3EBC30|nr:PTS sugar transporter subunit IIA [Enterococcus sp. 6D12_DIV0197]OUZ23051.1 hypothetical protein A5867_000730 [Enterococcus sp. 6D12_DIV0197]